MCANLQQIRRERDKVLGGAFDLAVEVAQIYISFTQVCI